MLGFLHGATRAPGKILFCPCLVRPESEHYTLGLVAAFSHPPQRSGVHLSPQQQLTQEGRTNMQSDEHPNDGTDKHQQDDDKDHGRCRRMVVGPDHADPIGGAAT